MSASERRAAAALRRQAAEQHGERGGDAAYRAYRSAVPGIGAARRVPMKTQIRAATEKRNGRDLVHTSGFFTIYDRAYPMWDVYGEYEEIVNRGAGRETIASKPDVAFLVNHTGMTMARTTNDTLVLEERDEGGWHDAWLNPQRRDVSDLIVAIEDRNIDQMSFAFMIPEAAGEWSEDWTTFAISRYDIDRGDVSAVNYGASPYTDIAARTAEVLNDIDHLPEGALRAAAERLQRRGQSPTEGRRERIVATGPRPSGADLAARLQSRIDRTADRMERAFGAYPGDTVIDQLRNAKMPWYEIRNASGDTSDASHDGEPGAATILIYDEIGGSFGTNAKQFAKDLEGITANHIVLRINSPGGSVFDALAIHSSLLHHPARVTTYIDGYAASAASVIAMAGDEVIMMPGSQMMIHCASAVTEGDDLDHERMQTFLRRQSENIADLYARKAGGDPGEWMERMRAETWSFANESVDLGLADRVYDVPVADREEREERMLPGRHLRALGRFGYRYQNRSEAPDPMQRRNGTPTQVRSSGQELCPCATDPTAACDFSGSRLFHGRPEAVDWRDEFADAVKVVERATAQSAAERSTPNRPTGRSIALIEAQLAASE